MSKGARRPYAEALTIARNMERVLTPYCERIQIAGSLRREAEDIGDIEFVVIPKNKEMFIEYLKNTGFTGKQFKQVYNDGEVQIEVYMATEENWGATLLYATGPKQYTIRLRALALKSRGMLLSHRGLFKRDTEEMIAGATEEEVLAALGSKWREPTERVK